MALYASRPQQALYFLPLPQGQGSLRPTFGRSVFTEGSMMRGPLGGAGGSPELVRVAVASPPSEPPEVVSLSLPALLC